MDGNKAFECLKEMTEDERKAVRVVLWKDGKCLDCQKKAKEIDIDHYEATEKGRYQEFMKGKLAWLENHLGEYLVAVSNAEFIENLGSQCWGGIGFKCGDSWPYQEDVKRHMMFYIGYNRLDYNGNDCNWYIGCYDDADGEFDSDEFKTFKDAADALADMIGNYIACPKD